MPEHTVGFIAGEEPKEGLEETLIFYKEATSKLVQYVPRRYYLYCLGQQSNLPSSPEGITISILQGQLLCKHP